MFNQISLKKGIDIFGNETVESITKELQQLYFRNSFVSKHKKFEP